MAQPNVAREPSMDEILASIRKIIENNEAMPDLAADAEDDGGFDITTGSEDRALLDHPVVVEQFHAEERHAAAVQPLPRAELMQGGQPALSLADVAARVRAASERHVASREMPEPVSVEPVAAPVRRRLDTGLCTLYLKLESANPGGSIKDRIGMSMIEAAEKRGDLKPGATLVEGTAGNTGIGLALVAQQKGYKLMLVVPDKMSREKIFNLKAMGAEVILTRSDVAKGHPEYYQDLAERIARETPGAYFINQFGNPDNPAAHEFGTGPEILRQIGGELDAIVFGCGSSGTMTGLSRCFAEHSPQTELVLADPVGSILTQYINEGTLSTKSGSWLVEGIGEDFLPQISDFSRVKKAYAISDGESFHTARELLAKEGILGGSSTGTLLAAALKYCREQTTPKKVLVFVCDTGNKYLSKMYNDYWMLDNGFIDRPQYGDLRDLILRPYSQRDTVVVSPTDLLTTAYQRMKLYDVSQLPVMEGDRLVGIVDESDVLLHVYGDETRFRDPVSTAMVSKLDRLDVRSPIEALLPVFDRGQVAIITDGDAFLGLITRIDLLNYLRRRAQ